MSGCKLIYFLLFTTFAYKVSCTNECMFSEINHKVLVKGTKPIIISLFDVMAGGYQRFC